MSTPVLHAFAAVLLLLLAGLQAQLWWGDAGWLETRHARYQTRLQQASNLEAEERNNRLGAEIVVLQDPDGAGLYTVEGLARQEMGMVRSDETFFLLPATQ